MKCSECSRRNHDDNQFCIYCGAALTTSPYTKELPSSALKSRVMVPPQDIDEIIKSRKTSFQSSATLSIYPAIFLFLVLVISLSGVYYWFFYRDVFQILAIDYQTTNLMNE